MLWEGVGAEVVKVQFIQCFLRRVVFLVEGSPVGVLTSVWNVLPLALFRGGIHWLSAGVAPWVRQFPEERWE